MATASPPWASAVLPMAMVFVSEATASSPTATLWSPEAVVWWPSAVPIMPLASACQPTAVAPGVVASLSPPTATVEGALAVAGWAPASSPPMATASVPVALAPAPTAVAPAAPATAPDPHSVVLAVTPSLQGAVVSAAAGKDSASEAVPTSKAVVRFFVRMFMIFLSSSDQDAAAQTGSERGGAAHDGPFPSSRAIRKVVTCRPGRTAGAATRGGMPRMHRGKNNFRGRLERSGLPPGGQTLIRPRSDPGQTSVRPPTTRISVVGAGCGMVALSS